MNSVSVESCLESIAEYYNAPRLGQPFIVNVENYSDYKRLRERMESDANKVCVYVSKYTSGDGELPSIDSAMREAASPGNRVLLGLSQALLLQDKKAAYESLARLVNYSVHGYLLVILCQFRNQLQPLVRRDPRLSRRVIFVEGQSVPVPSIRIARDPSECHGKEVLHGINEFLGRFEKTGETNASSFTEYTVVTMLSQEFFKEAMMPVRLCESSYDTLCNMYSEIADYTRESYGTKEQWDKLLASCNECESLYDALARSIKTEGALEATIVKQLGSGEEHSLWVLWLKLKVAGCKTNEYLDLAIKRTHQVFDFEESILGELLNHRPDDPAFRTLYQQRRELLANLQPNLAYLQEYCGCAGAKGRQEAFYLTDLTEMERYRFVHCLARNHYNRDEIELLTSLFSDDLHAYISRFDFDESNTTVPSSKKYLLGELTSYFEEYKLQKLTNTIAPDFIDKVNRIAKDRPYNMLRSRSSIVVQMDRDDIDAYFFDALGVEYLAYFIRKCRERGLLCEISIGRCELPSITACNKEFEQYFSSIKKIDELDELKHHSAIYNYEKTHDPIHIFDELAIINKFIEAAQIKLVTEQAKRVVVVADHGASRLAVLYEHEEQRTKLELDEKSVHSGRCCRSEQDPCINGVAFENGYAVLANYDRFKGGRKANLEVHGGATLEEVVVPVIVMSLPPEKLCLSLKESAIVLRQKEVATLKLYASVAIAEPRLKIKDNFYMGIIQQDSRWSVFELSDVRRSGDYEAEVFDGNKSMNTVLAFTVQRATGRERQLF